MGISAIAGFGNCRISSIHGNPYSLNAIQKIGQNNDRSGKPLVIASEEKKEDLYVKDYGTLDATKSTASGDFAEMLGIQECMLLFPSRLLHTHVNLSQDLKHFQ